MKLACLLFLPYLLPYFVAIIFNHYGIWGRSQEQQRFLLIGTVIIWLLLLIPSARRAGSLSNSIFIT